MNGLRAALRKAYRWWTHRTTEERWVLGGLPSLTVLGAVTGGWLGALVVGALVGLTALLLAILGKVVNHTASPEAMQARADREKVQAARQEELEPFFVGVAVLGLFALVAWGLFGSSISAIVESPNPEQRVAEMVGVAAPDTLRFTDNNGSRYFFLRPSHGLHGRFRTVKVRDRAVAGFYLETIEVDCTPGAVRVRWRALDSTEPSEHAALVTGNALAGTGRDLWHAPDETEYAQALGTNMEAALVRSVCQ